jgi:ABC-type transport system involved in multi-copper enzyme maturation permease subunit
MLALLKKDFKLNRIPIFGGALLIGTPYLVMAPTALFSREAARIVISQDSTVVLGMALLMSVAVTAIFGGAAFALERRERSAEFLAMLPVGRSKIVLSKLVIGAGFPVIFWAANLLYFRLIARYSDRLNWQNHQIFVEIVMAGVAMVMSFGIAWMASSILWSPAIAACISMGVSLVWLVCVAALWTQSSPEGPIEYEVGELLMVGPAIVGVLGILAGTILFVRRAEP